MASRRPTRAGLVDCDTHNSWESWSEVEPFLATRWRDHVRTYGSRRYAGTAYPRFWSNPEEQIPPSGRAPGADVDFMIADHLDRHQIAYTMLIPLNHVTDGMQNLALADALARAINEWQAAVWLDRDSRFRCSIVISSEDPENAAAEVRRAAQDRRFVQVQFAGRPAEPMGRKKYWPIYQACVDVGLPVMSHAFGSTGQPITGAGWPSYYLEDHIGPPQSMQANITSLVMEGVFDRFPTLKIVSVENGFGWVPALVWRMDNAYSVLRNEVPHLQRRPSEYVAEHVYFATQPVEEPNKPHHFQQLMDQYPAFADRLLFSSDYPHWDGDAPDRALPLIRDPGVRDRILRRNARQLYGLS